MFYQFAWVHQQHTKGKVQQVVVQWLILELILENLLVKPKFKRRGGMQARENPRNKQGAEQSTMGDRQSSKSLLSTLLLIH